MHGREKEKRSVVHLLVPCSIYTMDNTAYTILCRYLHILDRHCGLGPGVVVQGEGVIFGTVDLRQDEGLLVFRFRVPGGDVVPVGVVHQLER